MLVLGHVLEKGMMGMKTFTQIVDEPSQSQGTLVGLTKMLVDMCCLKVTNLNGSIGSPHMVRIPKTNNGHRANQNHTFRDFKCTILVSKNLHVIKYLERAGHGWKCSCNFCGGAISITGHACRSCLKVANLSESKYTHHKICLPKTNTGSKKPTLCTTSIHLEASNVHFWCMNVGLDNVLRCLCVSYVYFFSIHPLLVRYETCN